jgi:hypothetical protein
MGYPFACLNWDWMYLICLSASSMRKLLFNEWGSSGNAQATLRSPHDQNNRLHQIGIVPPGSTMVGKRVPNAVVCLMSALDFHHMTTQIPRELWRAVPRGAWRPMNIHPPLNLTYVSGAAFSFGVEEHDVHGVTVRVYSPAKTVADCFKHRSKVGLDVALETLREAWRSRKASVDELIEAAEVNRVSRIMRAYLEASV